MTIRPASQGQNNSDEEKQFADIKGGIAFQTTPAFTSYRRYGVVLPAMVEGYSLI